jgi:hypothetical protein
MSLLIRRDATLRISGALHLSIFEQPNNNGFFNLEVFLCCESILHDPGRGINALPETK